MIKQIAIAAAGVLALAACKPAAKADSLPAAASNQAQLAAEASDQAAYDADADADAPPSDPVDAYVWRAEHCAFAGGEIGGDGSQHDQDTMIKMEELDCGDSLAPDGKALRAAHANDAAAVAKIDAALKLLDETFGA